MKDIGGIAGVREYWGPQLAVLGASYVSFKAVIDDRMMDVGNW